VLAGKAGQLRGGGHRELAVSARIWMFWKHDAGC